MNREVTEMLEAIKFSMESRDVEEMLADAAEEFVKTYANSYYTQRGPSIETREGVTVLKGDMPINPSKVTSYIVVVDGDKVELRVYGSFASDDVETSGFGQTSAKKVLSLAKLNASTLAKTIADLGKKAKP